MRPPVGQDPKLLFDAGVEILDTEVEGLSVVVFGTIEPSECEHGAHIAPATEPAAQPWN